MLCMRGLSSPLCAAAATARPLQPTAVLPVAAASAAPLRRAMGTAKPDPKLTWRTTRPGHHFSVGINNGFMPRSAPVTELPPRFAALDAILRDMPIVKTDGTSGLLASGDLGRAVNETLPLLSVQDVRSPAVASALFRDYSMLASAYMLEPSHHGMNETGEYTQGRGVLPEQVAVPLTTLGRMIDYLPFMDYAQSYALNNWTLKDPSAPPTLDNLSMFRRFHGGSDENGFVMVHVAMVAQTAKQVQCQQAAIHAAAAGDHAALAAALNGHSDFLKQIYDVFVRMWAASSPKAYLAFRTFIMGHVGNDSIFPNGVVYSGVSDQPQAFRGETGAQDSIIPSSDNLMQLQYPNNKLSEYLIDLRRYRPADAQAYLHWLFHATQSAKVAETSLQNVHSALGRFRNLNMIQMIRSQHWSMTKSYIISNTKHPKATGGTPITTWLPNNLGMTLDHMLQIAGHIERLQDQGQQLSPEDTAEFEGLRASLDSKIMRLQEEVMGLQSDFKDQEVDEFRSETANA